MTDHPPTAQAPITMPTEQDIVNELLAARVAQADLPHDIHCADKHLDRVIEMHAEQDRIVEGCVEVTRRQLAMLCDPAVLGRFGAG